MAEQSRIVADAGSQGVFIVDSAGAFLTDDVRRRVAAMRAALPDDVAVGIHEHNNLSLAVANSARGDQRGRDARRHLAGRPRRRRGQLPDGGARRGARAHGHRDRHRPLDAAGRRRRGRPRRDHAAADRDRPADGHDGLRGRARELPPARASGPASGSASIRATSSSSWASAGSSSARRTRSSGSPPRWRRERDALRDHGRPRRRPHRHAGDERRLGRARLVGRRGLGRACDAGDRAVHVLTN